MQVMTRSTLVELISVVHADLSETDLRWADFRKVDNAFPLSSDPILYDYTNLNQADLSKADLREF